MRINVGICDDELKYRQEYTRFCEQWAQKNGHTVEISAYACGMDLLQADNASLDVLLLDIHMPGLDGLAVATALREQNRTLYILFFTTQTQCAMAGYRVRAFGFLQKPVGFDLFCREMDSVAQMIFGRQGERLTVKCGQAFYTVQINELLYADAQGHTVQLIQEYTSVRCSASLASLEEGLAEKGFFRCHKSYLINFKKVKHIGGAEVTMSNDAKIPISKHRRKALLQQFVAQKGLGL